MPVLEDYDKRLGLQPLTLEEVLVEVESAESFLSRAPADLDDAARDRDERVIVWLHDRVRALEVELETFHDGVASKGDADQAWRAAVRGLLQSGASLEAMRRVLEEWAR